MDWKKRWTALAEFLGQALGSDYEIAVHDFTGEEPRLLALVNPQVSGRAQNAPPSNLALDFWRSRTFEGSDGRTGYRGISASGEALHCSTFFIKDETGKLVGLLCINTDYHELLEAHDKLGALIGELGLRANLPITESFNMNVRELVQANLHRVCPGYEEQVGRMSQKEKLEVIEGLSDLGTFLVKGAIGCVAESLGVSVPTIYRYLNMIKK